MFDDRAMYRLRWILPLFFCWVGAGAYAQCNALRPQVTIDFNTDQDCAPVTVTQFQIIYYFNVAQNPNTIQIRYVWNDPANTETTIGLGNGLVASAGNTAFTANASFTYFNNNGECSIRPTTYILINGVVCPTSEQRQSAFFWGTDVQANARVELAPNSWDVCFNNPVVNATFADVSEFNCNINVEPDNPNRFTRHVQIVYGTNHNAAATIRNLSLTDGGPQPLTNATGALANPQTRGTAGLPVTAGYFGPLQTIPFPADGPVSVSFPMNAPPNALNLVGNRFEITLFNWNFCNPWNGSTANPNYEDAVSTTAYITIVDAPVPAFQTRDNTGTPTTDFCIGETIFFNNQTLGASGLNFLWQFYDDAMGSVLAGTSTQPNPTFAYNTGGPKLIRVTASNPTAQGSCQAQTTRLVNITPALVAQIATTDLNDLPITPQVCQETQAPLSTFSVRFRDVSAGVVTPNTQWRWEFLAPSGTVIRREPASGFSSTLLGPFDVNYTTPGRYRIRLFIRDQLTLCETNDEAEVLVFEKPRPLFTASRVCEGAATAFQNQSTLNAIQGEQIVLREWDFSYDGTFDKDPAFDNQTAFNRPLGAPGTYPVALRVTTNQAACSDLFVLPVVVDANPLPLIVPDQTSGCSVLPVQFANASTLPAGATLARYDWEVDEGLGFVIRHTQLAGDPTIPNGWSNNFRNTLTTNRLFSVRLRATTAQGCVATSPVVVITVFPGTASGFFAPAYSPFADNCSPQSVQFTVDNATTALTPTDYRWRVTNNSNVLIDQSTGTTATFQFNFVNTTQAIQHFQVRLTTTLPSGCSGDSTRLIRISPIPPSAIRIDTLVNTCETMRLQAVALNPGLSNYSWTVLENGVPVVNQSGATESVTFERARLSTPQNITFQLQTRNLANCVSPVTVQTITIPAVDNINSQFTATPTVQTLPSRSIQVTATTPGPWSYTWELGDGTVLTGVSSSQHTYATYGNYTVRLTVRNGECVTTSSQVVTILAIPPIVDFSYDPPQGCLPLQVRFTNRSQFADPNSYQWQFGDGKTSTQINPTYTYFEPGTYTVSLTAANSTGQSATEVKQRIIVVHPLPEARFDVRPKVVEVPDGILYTSNRSFNATRYEWDFGDGEKSFLPEPLHRYKQEGVYDITLIAFNQFNCSDTARMPGAVTAKKGGELLVPNAFSPNVAGGFSDGSPGKNDVFLPLIRGVREFEMLIFNRWGELLFVSRDTQTGWDGFYKGKPCVQDVYVYRITATFEDGEKIVRVGDVNLIR
jgi:gliding motility-associated-like protein